MLDTGRKNNEITKRKFASFATEKGVLDEEIAGLKTQLAELAAERDSLKEQATPGQTQDLTQELNRLRQEKAELDRRLQEAEAAHSTDSAIQERDASLVSVYQSHKRAHL